MIKINLKLLRDTLSNLIDIFYGIAEICMDYFMIFIGVIGLFYLSVSFPSSILNNIWGYIPQELLNEGIKNGTFSQIVKSFFLIWVLFKMMIRILSYSLNKELLSSVVEIFLGSGLVFAGIYFKPVVTTDIILSFVCLFMVIKLELIFILRIFKISTRHFGSYEIDRTAPQKEGREEP